MDEFEKIEIFPENQTRKKWKEDFVCAIKNKNLLEVEKLIDESNAFYYDEFIHHAYIDDNFKFHFDTNVIENILKKSKENVLEVINFIWSVSNLKELPKDFIYSSETIENFIKPMVLPMLCPFVVTGVYVIGLFFKFQFKVKIDESYPDFEIYQQSYHKFYGFGKRNEYSVYNNLENKLHLDLSVYKRNKESELWKFFEMIQYVDSIVMNFDEHKYESKIFQHNWQENCGKEKKESKKIFKPLLHIVEYLRDYVAFDNEIFLNKNNPNIIKIILFKSLVFQQLTDEEQNGITKLITLLQVTNLFSDAVWFKDVILQCSSINLLEKYPECFPDHVDPIYREVFAEISKLKYDKNKDRYSFDNCLLDIKNIEKLIKHIEQAGKNIKDFTDNIQEDRDIGESKNKERFPQLAEKDNVYIAVLIKLAIYEQMCRFSAKIVNEKFLQSPLRNKKIFFETTQKIMTINESVGENDWKKYFNKYAEKLKIIFPSMPEKEIKIKWQAACRLRLSLVLLF